MSDHRYHPTVRKMNDLLRVELGANPRYAWRWSEDLWHVLEVLDLDGRPLYVEERSPQGLVVGMMPKTATKKLLPQHHDQWIVCALVEVNVADGSIAGTGNHTWVPVSAANGVVCLPEYEEPNPIFTQSIIDTIRDSRKQRPKDLTADWEERERKREKDHWNRVYDEIRDSATAFQNVPGMRAHVSFPSVN